MSASGELNHRHTASAENVDRATKFKNCLDKILGFVEEMLPHIPEGVYLEQMDNLKELFNLKPNENFSHQIVTQLVADFREMPQVQQEYRLSSYVPKEFVKNTTDAEKLKMKDANGKNKYMLCPLCDKCVSCQYFYKHKKTEECKKGIQNKRLTKSVNSVKTDPLTRCILFIRSGMGKRIAVELKRLENSYNFWRKVKPEEIPYWITDEQIKEQFKKSNAKLRVYGKKKMYWS